MKRINIYFSKERGNENKKTIMRIKKKQNKTKQKPKENC
jgi:hypothetical protein